MDIFSVLTLIGGLALFLFGMNAMGDGLAKMAGGKLESILEKLTAKRIYGLLLGVAVTAIIQSSSATTVMVVGFVNSGIMQLSRAVGVIMGANIGTTVTSWLLSLTGIEGSGIFISMLKPSSFSPILAAIGIILVMATKGESKKKDIGNILLGFAILMFGMETMSDSVSPLADDPNFASILTTFSNPILGLIAGAVLTAIIQSSSASIGILQALCSTGAVSYSIALPIIMGQNIGTCVTSLISSIGANKNARSASMIHLYFNLIGTVIFMSVFYALNHFVHFDFLQDVAGASGIAIIHSLFNIGCCVVLFPFADKLVKLAEISVPDHKSKKSEEEDKDAIVIDERFLERPAFAMEICKNKTHDMALETKEALMLALDVLDHYDEHKAKRVIELEQRVDVYEDVLGTYLVKLSSKNLSVEDSQRMSIILHSISDFERISDHAINIVESAQEMKDKNIEFTDVAKKELRVLCKAVHDVVVQAIDVFVARDVEGATHVEPLEEVIDVLTKKVKQNHVERLQKGECTILLGLILEDVLINLERVSDHCSNIAVEMIAIDGQGFDTHEYLDQLSDDRKEKFNKEYEVLKEKYRI